MSPADGHSLLFHTILGSLWFIQLWFIQIILINFGWNILVYVLRIHIHIHPPTATRWDSRYPACVAVTGGWRWPCLSPPRTLTRSRPSGGGDPRSHCEPTALGLNDVKWPLYTVLLPRSGSGGYLIQSFHEFVLSLSWAWSVYSFLCFGSKLDVSYVEAPCCLAVHFLS